MSHKATLLGAAASIVLLCANVSAANAGQYRGWYVGLEGGADWVQNDTMNFARGPIGAAPTFLNRDTFEFETGWTGIATVGYGFWTHWRVELEGGYRHNSIDTVHFVVGPPFKTSPGGELNEWTVMANVAYDFMLTDRLGLSLGVGAGMDDANLQVTPTLIVGTFHQDDNDWNFAYQLMAGLSYSLGYQSELLLNYRYMNVQGPDWEGRATGPDFLRFGSDDITKHTVTIGLRFHLQADEPVEAAPVEGPPPELPPAPPAQSFMIFFGFNKCNITPEADNVLTQAAAAAKQMGSATVQIVGHTDTKGTNSYNQKLSECRAQAAKSNMVGKGVPNGSIHTMGKGETELLVQTADNVKEPQNRRATIDMQ